MVRIAFTTTLVPFDGANVILFPRSLLGTRAKSVRIRGTINDHPFTATAYAWSDGQLAIAIDEGMRTRMGIKGTTMLDVALEREPMPVRHSEPDNLPMAPYQRPYAP